MASHFYLLIFFILILVSMSKVVLVLTRFWVDILFY
jgi:hypothetical protein